MRSVLAVLWVGGLASCTTFVEPGDARPEGVGGNASDTTTSTSGNASTSTGLAPVPATVRLIDIADAAAANILVFANDVDGNLVDEAVSDATGIVQLAMPEGGSLHIATEVSARYDGELSVLRVMVSQFMLSEGVDVTWRVPESGSSYDSATENRPMSVTVFAHPMPLDLPIATMRIAMSCAGEYATTEESIHLDGYAGCPGEDTFTIFAWGYDTNDALIAEGKMTNAPFVPNESRTYQLQMDPVSPRTSKVALTAPLGAENLLLLVDTRADRFSHMAYTEAFDTTFASVSQPISSLFDSFEISGSAENTMERSVFRRRVRGTGPLPTNLMLNVADLAPLRFDALDLSEPRHPRIEASLGAGPVGDYVSSTLSWTGSSKGTHWAGFAPARSAITLRVPNVPEEIADWLLPEGETMSLPVTVAHVSSEITVSQLDATRVDVGTASDYTTFATTSP